MLGFKKKHEFNFVEKGEGEPLILLHGLFGELSNFDSIMNHFSNKFRVIGMALPLYEMPIISTNIKSLAKHLEEFIEHLKYDKVHLLGNSLGGHIGLVYAAKKPSKIASLTLTGSSGLYESAFGAGFPRREDKAFLRKRIEQTFYDPKMVTDELVNECHEAVNNKEKLIRILRLAKSAIRHNMRNELPMLTFPTCLIWGKNDNITPPHVADEFHEKITDSDLFWIDKCGHAPMMEHPETFNNLLEQWYNKKF